MMDSEVGSSYGVCMAGNAYVRATIMGSIIPLFVAFFSWRTINDTEEGMR